MAKARKRKAKKKPVRETQPSLQDSDGELIDPVEPVVQDAADDYCDKLTEFNDSKAAKKTAKDVVVEAMKDHNVSQVQMHNGKLLILKDKSEVHVKAAQKKKPVDEEV